MDSVLPAEAGASVLRPVVAKIADALHGRPLADAESVIEAARRILWMRIFTGVDGEAVMTMLNASSSARYAAAEIAAASVSAADPLLTAERALLELRMQLYTAAYGTASEVRIERMMPD